MSVLIVGVPGRLAPSTFTVGRVKNILKYRESWMGFGMKNPRTCNLRQTRPVGPMILCSDLDCYGKCVELTENERVEDQRYQKMKAWENPI